MYSSQRLFFVTTRGWADIAKRVHGVKLTNTEAHGNLRRRKDAMSLETSWWLSVLDRLEPSFFSSGASKEDVSWSVAWHQQAYHVVSTVLELLSLLHSKGVDKTRDGMFGILATDVEHDGTSRFPFVLLCVSLSEEKTRCGTMFYAAKSICFSRG